MMAQGLGGVKDDGSSPPVSLLWSDPDGEGGSFVQVACEDIQASRRI
jgi:hypothetical protein